MKSHSIRADSGARFHRGLCSPLIHYIVSYGSGSRQRRPRSDCACAQSDLGLFVRACTKSTFCSPRLNYHECDISSVKWALFSILGFTVPELYMLLSYDSLKCRNSTVSVQMHDWLGFCSFLVIILSFCTKPTCSLVKFTILFKLKAPPAKKNTTKQ